MNNIDKRRGTVKNILEYIISQISATRGSRFFVKIKADHNTRVLVQLALIHLLKTNGIAFSLEHHPQKRTKIFIDDVPRFKKRLSRILSGINESIEGAYWLYRHRTRSLEKASIII